MNLFEKSKARGISSPYAQGFMAYDEVDGKIRVDYEKTAKMLAQDAALTTAANVGVISRLKKAFLFFFAAAKWDLRVKLIYNSG